MDKKSKITRSQRNITIVGFIPPPIGGVSVHVSRLLQHLEKDNYQYMFLDLKRISKIELLFSFIKVDIVHLHTANIYLRFILALISKIKGSVFIYTVHGDFGRYGKLKTYVEKLTLLLATVPIVINKKSYITSVRINRNTHLVSGFIPPVGKDISLPVEIRSKIDRARNEYLKLICTNASQLNFDVEGKEIYGIVDLIKIAPTLKSACMFISNPYGDYQEYLEENNIVLPSNVYLIEEEHNFVEVIKLTDIMVRNTRTDGDSLSVKEGLFFNKKVYATDVVDRPHGVIKYSNIRELRELLNSTSPIEKVEVENGFNNLKSIYDNYID